MGARLNEAAEENDMLESEVIRRALRFYENENPDEFAAFEDVQHGPTVANVARIEPEAFVEDGSAEAVGEIVEEPTDETADETADETTDETGEVGASEDAEAGEDGTNSESDDALTGGVYDPTKEVR